MINIIFPLHSTVIGYIDFSIYLAYIFDVKASLELNSSQSSVSSRITVAHPWEAD